MPASEQKKSSNRRMSSLTLVILAVNLIPIILMGFGIFYLDKYKQNLIAASYINIEREARTLAYIIEAGNGAFPDPDRLELDATVVVLNENGEPVTIDGQAATGVRFANDFIGEEDPGYEGALETLASAFVHLNPLQSDLPQFQGYEVGDFARAYPEAALALEGEPAFAAWAKDNTFILSVAYPVSERGKPGALVLFRSGAPITAAIDEVRIDIIKAFIIVLIITFLLSVYLSSFIAIPLKRLARAAEDIRRGKREIIAIPDLSDRKDEIGELSITLREMAAALQKRMSAIEHFAADVSHEIKNPLTSLRSAIETAMAVKKQEDRERLMNIILQDIQRLDRLITDISYTSRLDTALARDQLHEVDLKTLMGELLDLWREPLQRMEDEEDGPAGRIERAFTETECRVMGKADSLAQVFQNLISNALSFSPEHQPVWVLMEKDVGEGLIFVSIEDRGPGIPEANLEKIFDRFYTDRPGDYSDKANSGLGLSIARQIIEAHNGRIYAENIKDDQDTVAGARFVVVLPAV